LINSVKPDDPRCIEPAQIDRDMFENQTLEVSRFERRGGFENEYPLRQKQLVFKPVSSSYFVSCRSDSSNHFLAPAASV
jgi:hypothetical protein